MKSILILFIVLSCGKKSLNHQSLEMLIASDLDSDGDGVTDINEIKSGSNHLIANIDPNTSLSENKIMLVDRVLNEYEVEIFPKRKIRQELLYSLSHPNTDISHINTATIDLNSSKKFWELFHNNITFNEYYFSSNKSVSYRMPRDFEESRMIVLNNFSDYGILNKVKESTYRLIISLPERDIVYYLHPSINLKDFLKTHHNAQFNQGEVVSLEGRHATSSPDEAETWYWFSLTDSFKSFEAVEAGKSYSFVYANKSEIENHIIQNGKIESHKTFSKKLSYRIRKTIFIPSFYKNNIEERSTTSLMDINNIEFRCTIWENVELGHIPFTPSLSDSLNWLHKEFIDDVKVIWSISSSKGLTFHFEAFTHKSPRFTFMSEEINQLTSPVGIIRSDCPYTKPNFVQRKLYTGHKEYFLAD